MNSLTLKRTAINSRVWLLVPLFCFTESMFTWLFLRNSHLTELYQKYLLVGVYGWMLYRFFKLENGDRWVVAVFTAVMIRMVLESLDKYNSWFRQPTMFTVLAPAIYVLFIKNVLQKIKASVLPLLCAFYLAAYVAFMALFGSGFSFSLEQIEMLDYGPFSGDGRLIHASHIFMMIVPLTYYGHLFLHQRKPIWLFLFVVCATILVIHQHRSVWSSALVAMTLYTLTAWRNNLLRINSLGRTVVVISAVAALALFYVSNLYPGLLGFLGDRFAEILDPTNENTTGSFRVAQRETYLKLFLQRPFFGWTFEGFEMPNPLVDWWPSGTGQHFHEGYVEMLFYEGIAGLAVKYGVLIYGCIRLFSKCLSAEAVVLLPFCISGLVFSLSYVLPLPFWGVVGMALFYLHSNKQCAYASIVQKSAPFRTAVLN